MTTQQKEKFKIGDLVKSTVSGNIGIVTDVSDGWPQPLVAIYKTYPHVGDCSNRAWELENKLEKLGQNNVCDTTKNKKETK